MRAFNPYEQNQLKKYYISIATAQKYGEMPVEYITGFAEFCGCDFLVNKDVLIPRVETVQIVDIALNYCSTIENRPPRIADIGCGSGAIGISLFLELQKKKTNCQMYLSDVSPKALQITRVNVKRLVSQKLQKNIKVLWSNLLRQYPQPPQQPKLPKFNLILANLPYIPSLRLPQLPLSIRNYEPLMALDGGAKGLQLIKALIKEASNYLTPDGLLILEINDSHNLKDFTGVKGYQKEIQKDCFNRNRFLLLTALLEKNRVGFRLETYAV